MVFLLSNDNPPPLWGYGWKKTLTKIALNDLKCISQWFSFLSNDTPLPLILGCKNEKRLSGQTELDLEAGNLVSILVMNMYNFM